MNEDNDFIFGLRPVIEAIKAGKTIDRLIVKKGLHGSLYYELVSLLRENNISYQAVPPERFTRYTNKNHQGVIAWLSSIEYQDIENIIPMLYEQGKEPLLLVLNGVSDVRNFGAIARSAESFGAHAVLIPEKGSARINADAIKTSAGALNSIPVCRLKSIVKSIEYLKEAGIKVVCASEKSDTDISAASLDGPVALVMGSEDRGISSEVLQLADITVNIPLVGITASLNVSVAAGILLYEVTRQRKEKI